MTLYAGNGNTTSYFCGNTYVSLPEFGLATLCLRSGTPVIKGAKTANTAKCASGENVALLNLDGAGNSNRTGGSATGPRSDYGAQQRNIGPPPAPRCTMTQGVGGGQILQPFERKPRGPLRAYRRRFWGGGGRGVIGED